MNKTKFLKVRGLTENSCDCSKFLLPKDVQEKFFKRPEYRKDVIFISTDSNLKIDGFDERDFLYELSEDSVFNNYIVPVENMVIEQYTSYLFYGLKEGIFDAKKHCWYVKNKNGKLKQIKDADKEYYFELDGKSYFLEDFIISGYMSRIYHQSLPKEGVLTAMDPSSIIYTIKCSDKFCINWEDVWENS